MDLFREHDIFNAKVKRVYFQGLHDLLAYLWNNPEWGPMRLLVHRQMAYVEVQFLLQEALVQVS